MDTDPESDRGRSGCREGWQVESQAQGCGKDSDGLASCPPRICNLGDSYD